MNSKHELLSSMYPHMLTTLQEVGRTQQTIVYIKWNEKQEDKFIKLQDDMLHIINQEKYLIISRQFALPKPILLY